MFTWSLERAVVGFLSGAAVFVQGVIDAVSPPNFQPVGDSHPIPGCPDAVECRTHGCAGDCSESIEAEERQIQCVVDECPNVFATVGLMNTHSYQQHLEPNPFKPSDDARVSYHRYPGATPGGDFQWFGITRTAPAAGAGSGVSAAEGGSAPLSPSVACTDPSPVGGEGVAPASDIRPSPGATHQKWESCWCGEHLSAEGSEAEVIRACGNFRSRHSHHKPK